MRGKAGILLSELTSDNIWENGKIYICKIVLRIIISHCRLLKCYSRQNKLHFGQNIPPKFYLSERYYSGDSLQSSSWINSVLAMTPRQQSKPVLDRFFVENILIVNHVAVNISCSTSLFTKCGIINLPDLSKWERLRRIEL